MLLFFLDLLDTLAISLSQSINVTKGDSTLGRCASSPVVLSHRFNTWCVLPALLRPYPPPIPLRHTSQTHTLTHSTCLCAAVTAGDSPYLASVTSTSCPLGLAPRYNLIFVTRSSLSWWRRRRKRSGGPPMHTSSSLTPFT